MTRSSSRRAKKTGDAFEDALVKCILEPLRRMGEVGRYDKLQPRVNFVRGEWRHVEHSGGDWILSSRGVYVAAEAKSTSSDRFARNLMPKHQQEHLDAALKDGGLAFLFLRFTKQAIPILYMIPWQSVPWRVLVSAQSVSADECKAWAVQSVGDAKRILSKERERAKC